MERRVRAAADSLERVPGPALAVGMFVTYLALAQYVIWLNDPVNLGAGFWPAAGLSLAVLLLLPTRRWVWVLPAIAAAEFVGDLLHGYPLGGIAFWAAANTVEPAVGALLIRRFGGAGPHLVPLPRLGRFLLFGVLVAPLVGGTIGSPGTVIFFDMTASDVWPKFVIGDALGVLVVAPILLCWLSTRDDGGTRRFEAVVLGVSLIAVTLLVFRNWSGTWDVTLPYLVLPFLVWAALRFGVRGAAAAGFVIAQVANAGTAFGYGPFAIAGAEPHAITLLQVFLMITLVSALILAAVVSDLVDRREAEARLAAKNEILEQALEEIQQSHLYIRKLEGILPICGSCKSVRNDDDSDWVALDSYLARSDAVSLSHTLCPTCEARELERL